MTSAEGGTLVSNEGVFSSWKQFEVSAERTEVDHLTKLCIVCRRIKANISFERCIKQPRDLRQQRMVRDR